MGSYLLGTRMTGLEAKQTLNKLGGGSFAADQLVFQLFEVLSVILN